MKEALRRAIAIRDGINRKTGYSDANITDGVNHLLTDNRQIFIPQFQVIENPTDVNALCKIINGDIIELEYVRFTGSQYIQFDFILSGNSRYELDMSLINNVGTGISSFQQTGKSTSVISTRNSGKIAIGGNTVDYIENTRGIFGQDYLNGKAIIFGEDIYPDLNNMGKPNYANFRIGHWYENGSSYYPITGNLYRFNHWENGVLAHQCVPCFNFAVSKAGLWDKKNNYFYNPNGTLSMGSIILNGGD